MAEGTKRYKRRRSTLGSRLTIQNKKARLGMRKERREEGLGSLKKQ